MRLHPALLACLLLFAAPALAAEDAHITDVGQVRQAFWKKTFTLVSAASGSTCKWLILRRAGLTGNAGRGKQRPVAGAKGDGASDAGME